MFVYQQIRLKAYRRIMKMRSREISLLVKAPPPSFPVTLFSPTESKRMEFPDSAKKEPDTIPEPKRVSPPKPKDNDDDEGDAGGGNAFAAQLRRRALKREQNAAVFEPKQNEAEIQWKKVCGNLSPICISLSQLCCENFDSKN
ncbi:unnamed protein product [Gongylonema pulchrum]|uniref:PEST proteolytic signal-containing nuclear protein n=1 Tax=Gongylonema pulchrum TaxID=637853 RepID=A0A183DFD9_9BILA|nr:unnamed protein product [Gongylonema pulchrum]